MLLKYITAYHYCIVVYMPEFWTWVIMPSMIWIRGCCIIICVPSQHVHSCICISCLSTRKTSPCPFSHPERRRLFDTSTSRELTSRELWWIWNKRMLPIWKPWLNSKAKWTPSKVTWTLYWSNFKPRRMLPSFYQPCYYCGYWCRRCHLFCWCCCGHCNSTCGKPADLSARS